jgi:hypothetical protein
MNSLKNLSVRGSELILVLSIIILTTPVFADEHDPFKITRADFSLNESMLELQLVIDSEIPEYIQMAIDQGFAVPLMFEVEIRAVNEYWLDDKVVSLKQQYILHFLPMLDAYSLLDVNTAERRYFDNRKAAMQFLEVVYNYPMLDIDNLSLDREYYARVRFGIDTDELPLPLKSSSLWANDWDIQSDWYEWKIIHPTHE